MRLEEEASEELVNSANKRGSSIKGLLSTAAFALPGGTAMKGLKKILPFLNESLPVELAIKGLAKVSPKTKDFISKASIGGYTAKDALDFLRNKTQETISSQPKPKEKEKNEFPNDSPALAKFRKEFMKGKESYKDPKLKRLEQQRIAKERSDAEKLEREKIQGSNQGQQKQQGSGAAALMQILQQINQVIG